VTALAVVGDSGPARHPGWAPIAERAPQLVVTVWRYLDQIALSLRPATVAAAGIALRGLAQHLVAEGLGCFAAVERRHIESYKQWLATAGTRNGRPPARNTIRQRLGLVRSFFDRIIEWDWADAPARTPMFAIDVPIADDPLPRFLDDAQAARLLATAAHAEPLDRLVVELLARTGLRASELCDLEADAVGRIGGAWWLRVPVGKLRNDRYILCTPPSSTCSPAGRPGTSGCWRSTAGPWTGTGSAGSFAVSPVPPGSVTSTPTNCATPSPPRPSTAACASKPSPPCSATAACA
jgi:hypothetical protein